MSEPVSTSPRTISIRTRFGAGAVALAAPLLFAAYTHQIWEDYYITYRSSRHLAEGHGLVYQLGEQVHTFTSPLGVLLPALGFALTGNDASALWLFRCISALALAATASLVVSHARDRGWPRLVCWFALCLGVFETKVVAFSANGQETALLVLFGTLAWHELTRIGGPRWPWLAVAYAGLMWTRPDAFLLAGAMTFGWWVFGPRALTADERSWWLSVIQAILIGGLLYLPWFLWAWHFYGSPVPQTIIAKSAESPDGFSLARILLAPLSCLVDNTAIDGLFAPIYANNGWPLPLLLVCRLLARIAAFVWVVPALPRPTRTASLAVLLGGIYFNQILPYPWYFAPWTILGAIALAGAFHSFASRVTFIGRLAFGLVAAGALAVGVAQAHTARLQQRIIEDNGRKQIGLWLREHAAPSDTVFLEPIGYIGYFSQLKILDYPGLCAPEVSRIVHSGPGGYARIITTLKPDWLVLRPYEIDSQNLQNSGMLKAYDAVKLWNLHPQIDACRFLPGRNWLDFDAEFLVFHRRNGGATHPPVAK